MGDKQSFGGATRTRRRPCTAASRWQTRPTRIRNRDWTAALGLVGRGLDLRASGGDLVLDDDVGAPFEGGGPRVDRLMFLQARLLALRVCAFCAPFELFELNATRKLYFSSTSMDDT